MYSNSLSPFVDRISRLKLCSNQACCQIVKDVKTGSTSSSSMNSNIMDLCSKCYAPFWSPRHDPGNQKIIRKIVEIYHTQFTKGCGKSHCRNLGFCCSSSSSENFLPMEPTAAAARAIELLASTFVQKAHIQEYYFCVGVDETKRRGMAEVLQTMGFPFAWAVKSLVECKDDPDRAASWLLSNAPTS